MKAIYCNHCGSIYGMCPPTCKTQRLRQAELAALEVAEKWADLWAERPTTNIDAQLYDAVCAYKAEKEKR